MFGHVGMGPVFPIGILGSLCDQAEKACSVLSWFSRKVKKKVDVHFKSGVTHMKNNGSVTATHPSLMDRKIEQLRQNKRPYQYRQRHSDEYTSSTDHGLEYSLCQSAAILRYHSKGEKQYFNGRVNNKKTGEWITCRHLARAVLDGAIGTKENGKFTTINSLGADGVSPGY